MRRLYASVSLLLVLIFTQSAEARFPRPFSHCESCGKYCCTDAECKPATRTCWDIKHKEICIPPVRFPWSKCCGPTRCGRVIQVKTLKEREYEVNRVQYDWKIQGAEAACPSPATTPQSTAPQDGVTVPPVPPAHTYLPPEGAFRR